MRDDRLLTWSKPCRRTILPTPTSATGCQVRPMPARPRWLLALPDALAQLEQLDRPLLTRRDLESLFGVSRPRAATLMRAFGAEWTGSIRTLPRTRVAPPASKAPDARHLPGRSRTPRPGADRTSPSQTHRDPRPGPRGRPPRPTCQPAGRRLGQPRSDRRAFHQRARRRRQALRPRPGSDPRLRPLRNPHQGGREIGLSEAGTRKAAAVHVSSASP